MKLFTLSFSAWLLAGGLAIAQETVPNRLTRADIQGAISWQNIHEPQSLGGNDWINALAFADAAGGIYWTDHLRTQIDAGIGTHGNQYRGEQIVINGVQTFTSSRLDVREASVAVSQQYQFFHNAFFHPHVGAGIEFAAQQRTEQYQPTVIFDSNTRTSRLITPEHAEGPQTRWLARPFVDVGYKAYLNRRAFFVNDARFGIRDGMDEFRLRFGLGVDF